MHYLQVYKATMCALNPGRHSHQSVVLMNHHGAVLQFPATFGAGLVERPYGMSHTGIDKKVDSHPAACNCRVLFAFLWQTAFLLVYVS